MTTIQYGGGPTLEQRRSFAGLKDGTQLPGYRGFIPQLKYRNGKTYGQDTHELLTSKDARPELEPIPLRDLRLPKPSGDNKLTEEMIPGYTGYIPRRPFKFGDTYKVDCDYCIDEHLRNYEKTSNDAHSLRMSSSSRPTLQANAFDPEVRDHLNTYRDTHPRRPIMAEDKRLSTEPPIPGYLGFVPRIDVTELGLGARYNRTTKLGLDNFYGETARAALSRSTPVTLQKTAPVPAAGSGAMYSKRIFVQPGMIPKYTGHCHQRRYNFGNTYGDSTRSLEVCQHEQTCYGDHMKTKLLTATPSVDTVA